jgi:hypothetical protein
MSSVPRVIGRYALHEEIAARRACLATLAAFALLAWPASEARSDESDECLKAPVDGQQLQRDGKLIDAHDRFVQCASKSCPPEIVQDCTRWAREVDEATPSVVVAARDARGHELTDVLVSIDGAAPTQGGARALPLDPGPHKFVFVRSGHPDIVDQAVLHEGEKNREVVATYPSLASSKLEDEPRARLSRPVPVLVWVAGGVSVAAFAVFGTFGALGVSERSADHCAPPVGCPSSEKSEVDTKFIVADVALGVGVVALGVTAWQFFARRSIPQQSGAVVDFHAVPGGGVATLGGRF